MIIFAPCEEFREIVNHTSPMEVDGDIQNLFKILKLGLTRLEPILAGNETVGSILVKYLEMLEV